MGFPLTQAELFYRMLQTQKAHIRFISFCYSKQEKVMELTVIQNIISVALASCNKKH